MSNVFYIKDSKVNVTKFCKVFCKILVVSFIIWFVLNPSFESSNMLFALTIAILSSIFFMVIAGHFVLETIFDFLFKKDFYKYLIFMMKEIIVSSIDVLKSVFSKGQYQGKVLIVPIPHGTSIGKILLVASSITLTPGTSVVAVNDYTLTIHCLLPNNISIQNGEFIHKVLSFKF